MDLRERRSKRPRQHCRGFLHATFPGSPPETPNVSGELKHLTAYVKYVRIGEHTDSRNAAYVPLVKWPRLPLIALATGDRLMRDPTTYLDDDIIGTTQSEASTIDGAGAGHVPKS